MFVSNTSTLVLLAKIGCLELFIDISPTIEIPAQVQKEVIFKKESYEARLIEKLVTSKKIIVKPVAPSEAAKIMLQFRLDIGEAAAYVLYDKKKHRAILTDDGELIKLCKLEKTPFICSMAIVIRLFEKKKLSKEKTIIKLEELHTIGRYSKELFEHFKSQVA